MPIPPDASSSVLISELETVLLDISPTEALVSENLVLEPESFATGASDRALSFPGAGLAVMIGPTVIHWIVQIALDFVGEARKAALHDLASSALWRLAKLFRRAPRVPRPTRDQSIEEITTALVRAGWGSERAPDLAVRLWDAGNSVGRALDPR